MRQVNLIQKDIFGSELKYINAVQTNLTVLTERHIEFLERGFFEDIGVSFDVYGDRKNRYGREVSRRPRARQHSQADRSSDPIFVPSQC